jgi:hypothetical protein
VLPLKCNNSGCHKQVYFFKKQSQDMFGYVRLGRARLSKGGFY